MKTVITAKVRLYPNQEQVAQFKAVTKEYQRLCNLVSQWYFDNDCKVNRKNSTKRCITIYVLNLKKLIQPWFSLPTVPLKLVTRLLKLN
ncbi:hypothetical protein V8V50_11325 [Ligilactobacillus salivarius]